VVSATNNQNIADLFEGVKYIIPNVNANANAKPPPSVEKTVPDASTAQNEAIAAFVQRSHKGWSLAGIGPSFEACRFDESSPCDLHLVKGEQLKVVSIMMRQFSKADGSTYWLVFESRPLDISAWKRERLVEQTRQEAEGKTLQDLTFEDCEGVFDSMRDYEPPEDIDPWT